MIGHAPVTGSGSDIFPCSADVDTNCYDKVQNILSPTLLYAAGTTLYFTVHNSPMWHVWRGKAKETGSDTLGWRMEMGDNPKIFGEEFIHGLEFNNAFYFMYAFIDWRFLYFFSLRDNPELHKIGEYWCVCVKSHYTRSHTSTSAQFFLSNVHTKLFFCCITACKSKQQVGV